mgnify:CR=1 FL=1
MKPDLSKIPLSCQDCTNNSSTFSCLSSEEKDELSVDKGNNFYKKGQTIFYEGNHPHGLYCIHSGKVKISKLGEEGKEQILRLAGKAETLGYRALLGNEPYKATATALEDSYVCYLSKRQFFELITKNNNLCLNMIHTLADDLRDSEQKLLDISQLTAKERISSALLILKDKFGYQEDGKTIDVKLTRRELGEFSGVTTETTIRTLSELNKENVIELKGKEIQILDEKNLTHRLHH